MGIVNYTYNRSTSGGEIITHLINASDGTGLHFDGSAGFVEFTPTDLGTKFSFEFIIQADSWNTQQFLVDFGTVGRFVFAGLTAESLNLSIFDGTSWKSLGVKVLDDLKVHQLTLTIDGTAAILYDNANQVGTATISAAHGIDSTTVARLGCEYNAVSNLFDGTMYRARFWNKTLTQAEVTASFEQADVPFADQYGSQTVLISVVTGLDGWDALNTWNSQTTGGSNMILSATGSGQYCRTNTALEVGAKYRLTYTAASVTGNSYFGGNWVGGFTNIHQIVAGTNTVDFTFEFATGFINDYFYCHSGGIATVTLSNLSLVKIGCAVDLDLSYANPTQSLMVQDRAGASDGTSSATGVVQVTPIEQLNSKSARIGTSAATPADGELMVSRINAGVTSNDSQVFNARESGNSRVGIGVNASYGAQLYGPSGTTNPIQLGTMDVSDGGTFAAKLSIDSAGSITSGVLTATENCNFKFQGGSNNDKGPNVELNTSAGTLLRLVREGRRAGGASNDVLVQTGLATALKLGTNSTTHVTVDSAGNVGIGRAPTTDLDLYKSGQDVELKIEAATSTANAYYTMRNDDAKQLHMRVGGSAVGGTTWAGLTGSNQASIEAQSCSSFTIGTHVAAPIVFVQARAAKVTIASDGLVTASNGIVDSTGPLKSNLLTNSEFSVWSNSTLENVASIGSNLDFDSGDTAWTKQAGWTIVDQGGGDYEAVATNAGSYSAWLYQAVGVVVGKLYKLTMTCSNYTDGAVAAFIYGGVAGTVYGNHLTGTGTSTLIFEAVDTTIYIGAASVAASTDVRVDDFTFDEVTPGIVSATLPAMDGWEKTNLTTVKLYREHQGSNTKDGSFYSAKLVNTRTAAGGIYWQTQAGTDRGNLIPRFAGRTVTFGAWLKQDTANEVKLAIADSDGETASSVAAATGSFVWHEVTRAVGASITTFKVYITTAGGAATTVSYFSQPMLVFGSAIGAGNYSAPSGEVIWFESRALSNKYHGKTGANGFSTQAIAVQNVEADSNGKVPKGAKAVNVSTLVRDSASVSSAGVCLTAGADTSLGYSEFQNFVAGIANDMYVGAEGTVPCDANGDIYTYILASGSNTFDIDTFHYYGVQLR